MENQENTEIINNHQFVWWLKKVQENFNGIENPEKVKDLKGCIAWFKGYKKVVKGAGVEWDYCVETLRALGIWDKKLTKNQAYLRENSAIVNNLFKAFVL